MQQVGWLTLSAEPAEKTPTLSSSGAANFVNMRDLPEIGARMTVLKRMLSRHWN
jgi:hypothetical protein